jgi:signal peptidase I
VDRTLERPALVSRSVARAPRGRGVVVLFACAVALVLALRGFVGEPIKVPTASMAPTVRAGDSVLVDKLAYRFGAPRRNDLVVFHRPVTGELMLKRVVGVGGDRVGIEDGVLRVNGRAVHEPYVDARTVDSVYFGPVRVPAGAVFLLGDRRSNSLDSRTFGPVRRNRILGRADLRIWPPSGIGGL